MTIERRDFLKLLGAGTVAASLPAGAGPVDSPDKAQEIHQDFRSDRPGTEYYFLGNGLILAALQSSPKAEDGSHCGLLVMSPEHFGRKSNTYLFHPERGLSQTRMIMLFGGRAYTPEYEASSVQWEYPDNVPTVVIRWQPGAGCEVLEQLYCTANEPVLVREVSVQNTGRLPIEAGGRLYLYPNLGYFDEYLTEREQITLTAKGYQTMCLFSPSAESAGDRFITVNFGTILPGEKKSATFILTLNMPRKDFETKGLLKMQEETRLYWSSRASFNFNDQSLNHLFLCSRSGLRAGVARTGKMDGSIWQYNMEWVRDQSMVAMAASMTGQTEIAHAILTRMLTNSVNIDGRTVDASRHRTPDTIELDQNGELLNAIYTNWVWSGDDTIAKLFWPKIRNVANYVLQAPFVDTESGLLKNSREYWERDLSHGVKEGFEQTYQLWNILGLRLASAMAAHMKEQDLSERWLAASGRMHESFLHHKKFSLVEEGRIIKRRLTTGEVQRTLVPFNRKAMPPGMPLNAETENLLEPDVSSVLPIALGVVDPGSEIALKTLAFTESLWNQRWNTGGYSRYNVSSEPDSPGPWPLATMFMARAYMEAGNYQMVRRALAWLNGAKGGKSGAWLEFYGERPTPPLPPVGVLPWTWAELVIFFIHHLAGIRPTAEKLTLRPKLLPGMDRIAGMAVVHNRRIQLTMLRDAEKSFALLDGEKLPMTGGVLETEFPTKDITLEIHTS